MDLGYQAALKAIEKIDKNKIGLIMCATMTPDYFTPSMAWLIQERLGLNEQEVMCFDLNAACSGFVYALSLIHILGSILIEIIVVARILPLSSSTYASF